LTAAQQQVAALRAQLTTAERGAQAWQAERARRVQLRAEHRQFRPGFLEWLTSLGKAMREWRHRDQAAAAQVEAAERALHDAYGELARLAREVDLAAQAAAQGEETARRAGTRRHPGRTRSGDEQWLSSRTSVQRLADRLTPLSTRLAGDDGEIWVGSPLTVHRRCDQPMFGIANDIAYNGLMINGTAPAAAQRFQEAYPLLPASEWIDVVSHVSDGHWIPAEGRRLDLILDALADLKFEMSQVMVIGPFRDIARQVHQRAHRYRGLVAGTIHTAQGKQAEIVILVLGSDPRRGGARRWAASKPNLLNVAVSRAQRRLCVIGDRQAWATQRHFDLLAHRLPASPPR